MPVVETTAGRLRGRDAGEVLCFEGIPYASSPRFAAPGPAPAWQGVRDATAPGPAAPQPPRPVAVFTHGELPPTSEADCLTLNVYTPSLAGGRPVLVWIHGGGFSIGHGSASLYSGERLAAAADAVVVTLNYRLGSLGWLGHPALAQDPAGPAANWGLLDQVAALQWVQDHIAAFGGDRDEVTLAGQSAGALCAIALLVAPPAAGLFRRAILQSPPLGDLAQPAELAARWAEALSAAAGAGAGGGPASNPARLRELDAKQIVATHEALLDHATFRGTRGGALPTIDPATLPVSPLETPGASPHVDVLIGHTAQEGTFFFRSPWRPPPPPERIPAIVAHLCHDDAPEAIVDDYRARAAGRGAPIDPVSILVDIATDAIVADPLARWAAHRAEAVGDRSRVYRYRLDHPGAGPELGATHTTDVPLLFGTWDDGGPGERLAGQAAGAAAVAGELAAACSSFIHGRGPGWAPLTSAASTPLRVFGSSPGVRIPFTDARWQNTNTEAGHKP